MERGIEREDRWIEREDVGGAHGLVAGEEERLAEKRGGGGLYPGRRGGGEGVRRLVRGEEERLAKRGTGR